MENIIIRQYKTGDRAALREIACDTAFMGASAEAFFSGREILADFLTLYFTDYEPESCFVAENDGRVIGYLIGARDIRESKKIFLSGIFPFLFVKGVFAGALFKTKNLSFLYSLIRSFIKSEFKAPPDISNSYPATLHINLREGFRGSGTGSRLMSAYLNYIISHRVRGVHLATVSEKAAIFFEKNKFVLLHKSRRSYFRSILRRDINCYVYGRKL